MKFEDFNKLKEEEHYNPAVIFSLRKDAQVKLDERYKFVIFNHVQLHFPANGEIVEAEGELGAFKFNSADKYRDLGGLKVILPLFARSKGYIEQFRYDKDMSVQYHNCADFVRQYLVKAGILKRNVVKPTVDELYIELRSLGLIPSIDILNKWWFKNEVKENETR